MGIDKGNTNANVIYFDSVYGVHFPEFSGQQGGGNAVHLLYEIQATPTVVVITPDHLIACNQIWPPNEVKVVDSVSAAGGVVQECFTSIIDICTVEAISVSPNPATDLINISFRIAEGLKLKIGIYDILGRTVWQTGPLYYPIGRYYITADLADKKEGYYFVEMITDGQVASVKKIILIK
jgi:hypothetical protein